MMWVGFKRKRRCDWSRPWWNLSFSPGDRNSPHLVDAEQIDNGALVRGSQKLLWEQSVL